MLCEVVSSLSLEVCKRLSVDVNFPQLCGKLQARHGGGRQGWLDRMPFKIFSSSESLEFHGAEPCKRAPHLTHCIRDSLRLPSQRAAAGAWSELVGCLGGDSGFSPNDLLSADPEP